MGDAEKDENVVPYWVSSTNWFVTDGSIDGAINFVTSSSPAEDADVTPVAVLLERPADSPPCEITISFREKHEIHSIYVRSTARIYEVYYASDKEDISNEYLCTVRCGAAMPEDTNGVLPRCDSNNTTEDGWVEIKVPDSLLQENKTVSSSNLSGNICPGLQSQYEATAEISDSSPCMSVTLRLLSLQIKTSVLIEEIYIFADLIEDNDPDPPVCDVRAVSLLSMLVPGLLPLSRSGSLQFNDKGFPDVKAGSRFLSSVGKTTDISFSDMSETSEVVASSMSGSSKVGLDPYHVSNLKAEENIGACGSVENELAEPIVKYEKTTTAELEEGSNQSRKAKSNETSDAYVRLEKILDDLVSRMGRIENFCMSFQESILKPLSGIETRLQHMEEQLDAFSKAAPLSSETDPNSRICCPSEHNSNLENEDCIPFSIATESSSHEKEAEVDESNLENEDCIPLSAVTESSSHEKGVSVAELTVSFPESLKCPGLIVKAPEFPDDDNDDDDDDDVSSNHNFVDLTQKEFLKNDKPFSIDTSLASALAAFIASTTDRSYVHSAHLMDVHSEKQSNDKHFIDSAYVAALSVVEWVLEDRNCDLPHEARDKIGRRGQSCSDVLYRDTLKTIDTFHITEGNMQPHCLCDELLVHGDDPSARIHPRGTKGLIVRQPEIPYGDDIPHCDENFDSRASDYPGAHSHALPNPASTPLALFLSSGRVSPSKLSLSSHDDDTLKPSFDDIFVTNKLHPECSESTDMYSFTGAISVADKHRGSSDDLDVVSQMNSHYELKQVSSHISGQDDLISNIKFNADETLNSWLPLEVLLGEKSDSKVHNGEDLIDNLDFHANRNFISGLPPEVLHDKSDDRIGSTNYANDSGIDKQLIPVKAQNLIQRSEIMDNTLFDLICNVGQYEISGIVKDGTAVSPVCFSNEQPFSNLI